LTVRLEKQKELQAAIALAQSEAKRHRDDFETLKTHQKAEVFLPELAKLEQRHHTLVSAKTAADTAKKTVITERSALRSTLETARIEAEKDIVIAEKNATQLSMGQKKVADVLAANTRWLTKNENDTELREQLPKLVASFSELSNARVSLGKSQKAEQENNADIKRLQSEKTKLEDILQKTKTEGETLNLALESLRKDRGPSLESLQVTFEKLKSQKEHTLRFDKLETRQKELNTESAKLAPEHKTLIEQITAKKTHIDLLREAIEATRLIAKLEEHRAELKPGESCPLCGALEHPFSNKDKRPIDRSAQLKKEIEELATLEKSGQTLSANVAKNEEALRQVIADIAECVLHLRDAPEDLDQQFTLAKQKIEHAQSVEKQIAESEKSLIERRGEYSRIREQVTASEKQLERCAKLASELTSEIKNTEKTASEIQATLTQSLGKFGLTCPETGKENETRELLSQRAQEWQTHQDARTKLQTQIEETKHTLAKLSDQIKAGKERVEDYIGAVTTEKLSDVPLPADLPVIKDITKTIAIRRDARAAAEATLTERTESLTVAYNQTTAEVATLLASLKDSDFDDVNSLKAALLQKEEAQRIAQQQKDLESKQSLLAGQEKQVSADLKELRDAAAPQGELLVDKEAQFKSMQEAIDTATARAAKVKAELEQDDYHRKIHKEKAKLLAEEKQHLGAWIRLRELIGSHDGRKFRTFAQGLSLDVLLRHANRHLAKLSERYHLKRVESGALKLEIVDIHQANTTRPMESLSGGESFLVSLALALGLSDLAGRNVRIDSLFIDEGFGALDHDSLDIAVAALEGLRSSSKTVGVISHIDLLKERIGAQLRVIPGPGGISTIEAIAG
jgi:exonuclease SbcC